MCGFAYNDPTDYTRRAEVASQLALNDAFLAMMGYQLNIPLWLDMP